jgi:hypothetical protein
MTSSLNVLDKNISRAVLSRREQALSSWRKEALPERAAGKSGTRE